MVELRVLTLHVDVHTGLFDDSPLRGYLNGREVLQCVPAFFMHEGRPSWSVFLQTRGLQGSESAEPESPPEAVRDAQRQGERAAFAALLHDLDADQRDRYERLRRWRADAARSQGVPQYVILTNAQALSLARLRPTTLEAVGSVRGLGAKRVKRHGKAILEVLGVPIAKTRPQGGAAVRSVDDVHSVAAAADDAISETPAS